MISGEKPMLCQGKYQVDQLVFKNNKPQDQKLDTLE
jgi:hypothetical protein